MNTLGKKQNEEKMLMIQFFAKRKFNFAEITNEVSWVFVAINVALALIPTAKQCLAEYFVAIAAMATILSAVMQRLTNRFTKIAAAARQLFDYELFGFAKPPRYGEYTEEKIKLYASKEKHRNNKRYITQISHSGIDKEHGVKDWYIIDDLWDNDKAVFECQKQNKLFDRGLTFWVEWSLIITISIPIAIAVVLNWNSSLGAVIKGFLSVISVVIKLFGTIHKTVELHKIMGLAEERFNNPNYSADSRQEVIDRRRQLSFIVPNFLHRILSKRIHENINDLYS